MEGKCYLAELAELGYLLKILNWRRIHLDKLLGVHMTVLERVRAGTLELVQELGQGLVGRQAQQQQSLIDR